MVATVEAVILHSPMHTLAREQRKLAAILAAQLVGYLLTVKGISPSLVSTSVIVLTCQYN